MQHPDVSGVANEVETLTVEFDALLYGRNETPKRLPVLGRRGADAGDRVGKGLRAEFAGNTERNREIEMPDPQAIDAWERGDGVCVFDAFRRLDLAKQRASTVGCGELVFDGPRPVTVMRDLQSDAAARLPGCTSWN